MTLKQNIDNTNNLKNNIKTINDQIKQSVVRGGGNTFKSLSEAPKRIQDMIKQYNKIAIWEGNESFKPAYGRISSWQKTLNCDFVIKRFIIFRKDSGGQGVRLGLDSQDYSTFRRPTEGGTYAGPPTKLSFSNKTVVYEIDNTDSYVINEAISKVIAIG